MTEGGRSQREPESAAYTRLPMVRRSNTSRHSRFAVAARPVFVDRSGRRLRRLRLFGGITLAGVVLYVSMIATAFFGGSDVAMPFLPQSAAESGAGRPLPTDAPADSVQPVAVPPDEPVASESPSQPEPGEPSPTPTVPAEPAPDAPGRSETAPGQTNAPEPPAPKHP
jgi:hypothetical protein